MKYFGYINITLVVLFFFLRFYLFLYLTQRERAQAGEAAGKG